MVIQLLYGIGAKDFDEAKGFLVLPCQRCGTTGVFTLFTSKRKVTCCPSALASPTTRCPAT